MTRSEIVEDLLQTNVTNTKEHCDELVSNATKIDSVAHSLRYIVEVDIPSIWTSDTEDVASLTANLTKNVEFLENLVKFTKDFAYTMQDFAASLEAQANKDGE